MALAILCGAQTVPYNNDEYSLTQFNPKHHALLNTKKRKVVINYILKTEQLSTNNKI